jgi:tetratricopeptide (TPR) repeat protein
VKGHRADVAVVDIILLANPWFFPHLETRFPELYRDSRPAIETYRAELARFIAPKALPADTTAYNAAVRLLFRDLIDKARAAGRPVYFSSGINAEEAPGHRLVASGLVFRLVPEDDTTPGIPPRDFAYRALPSPRVNRLSDQIRVEYAEGYANQGAHLLEQGKAREAADRFRRALSVYPDFPEVRALLDSATRLP